MRPFEYRSSTITLLCYESTLTLYSSYYCIVQYYQSTLVMLPGPVLGLPVFPGLSINSMLSTSPPALPPNPRLSQYSRQQSYLKAQDWQVNAENGGLRLINKHKKQNQGKIVKHLLKKFVTSGSFMGISFPVFAMKPESILETYAKSVAAAPLFFENIERDALQRVKKFVAFTFSFSRLFTDIDKPFNPTIGETFQAEIAGGKYAAEQTSHHPPQSSFLFKGQGYRLHATLELVADIGVNSAQGLFYGDLTVEFEDGGRVFGRILSGEMSGFVMGENQFQPQGSSYAYDPDSRIICTFKRQSKDCFKGQVGLLKEKYLNRFLEALKSKDRFKNLQAFKEKDFECILSHMTGCWTRNVVFNQKVYADFNDQRYLPFQPQAEKELLPSDSRHRKDIQLLTKGQLQQSQKQKQTLEELQRLYRKLRKTEAKGPSKKQVLPDQKPPGTSKDI